MLGRKFFLPFDSVVNFLIAFNRSQTKDKTTLRTLRYIFNLASARGDKFGFEFFKHLCRVPLTTRQIRKSARKLVSFVSAEEITALITAEQPAE